MRREDKEERIQSLGSSVQGVEVLQESSAL